MKDKDRLLELLESFGLQPDEERQTVNEVPRDVITLTAHQGGVEGFAYFHCEFVFHEDGSFKSVGVWE